MYSALPQDYEECTVFEIGGIRLLLLKFCVIDSSSSHKSANNVLLTITAVCNYATQLSKTRSVVAKLVATLPDYYKLQHSHYKHIKSYNMRLNWWCYAFRHNN